MDYTKNQIPVLLTPHPENPDIIIGSFSYVISEFEAFKQVGFNVILLSSDKLPIEKKYVSLNGAYYNIWQNDDTFIINYIAANLNLVVDPNHFNNVIPTGVDGMCRTISYSDVVIQDGQLVFPSFLIKNSFNIIVNSKQIPVSFIILEYDTYGNIQTGNRLLFGPDGAPIIPERCYIDRDGFAKTGDGKRIIMIYPVNTSFDPILEPAFEHAVEQENIIIQEPAFEHAVEQENIIIQEPAFEHAVEQENIIIQEPVVETESEPIIEPIVETESEPVIDSVVETESEPIIDSIVETESGPVMETEATE